MNIDLTEKLIEAIKKWPVLYSTSHPFFRNNLWQQEAWREIEQEVNCKNVTFLKSKWGYLKGTYAQYKQIQHNIANNSIPPKKKKLATWVWGPYLSFLDQNPADETQDPLDETQSSSQQFAANDGNNYCSATNDTHISLPPGEETVKIVPSHEPSSASVKNTKKRYRGRRRIDSDSKVGENEEDKDDAPIRSPHREETVNIEPNSEPSSALAKNRRYSESRRIDLDPKVHVKKVNEDDTHISSPHREETVKNEPIPEFYSTFVENTENRYSGRRKIMVKMERSPEPSPALLETSNSEDRYRRKRRIESVSEVDQREENEESTTMQNIQKSSSTTRQDNSCNSEKVEVKCDAVDLFFLGYADTFKRLSRRKQVLVKFEIAKAFLQAELGDISDL